MGRPDTAGSASKPPALWPVRAWHRRQPEHRHVLGLPVRHLRSLGWRRRADDARAEVFALVRRGRTPQRQNMRVCGIVDRLLHHMRCCQHHPIGPDDESHPARHALEVRPRGYGDRHHARIRSSVFWLTRCPRRPDQQHGSNQQGWYPHGFTTTARGQVPYLQSLFVPLAPRCPRFHHSRRRSPCWQRHERPRRARWRRARSRR